MGGTLENPYELDKKSLLWDNIHNWTEDENEN